MALVAFISNVVQYAELVDYNFRPIMSIMHFVVIIYIINKVKKNTYQKL